MSGCPQTTKPFNVRLPAWVIDYVDRRSEQLGTTKKQVVVEAISCLRAEEIRALLLEGYEEMRELNRQMAEEGMAASAECLPEW